MKLRFKTPQAIFNFVSKHLLEQKERAIKDNGEGCQYHASNGLKCAVGCLITEKAYNPVIEGRSLDSFGGPLKEDPLFKVLRASGVSLEQKNLELMSALQIIHDVEPPSTWRSKLKQLAAAFKLKWKHKK